MKKNKTAITPINCEEAVARFNDYMDNFLKAPERRKLLKHLSECRSCLERFEFEQILKSRINELSKDDKNQAFIQKIENLIVSIT